jgi:hypothetical protein
MVILSTSSALAPNSKTKSIVNQMNYVFFFGFAFTNWNCPNSCQDDIHIFAFATFEVSFTHFFIECPFYK